MLLRNTETYLKLQGATSEKAVSVSFVVFAFTVYIIYFNNINPFLLTYLSFTCKDRYDVPGFVNLLKPTGHVMYRKFNIHESYSFLTQYLCVLYLSENKQRLVPLTS